MMQGADSVFGFRSPTQLAASMACVLWLACGSAQAQKLSLFSTAPAGDALPAPWRVVAFPGGSKPVTKFSIEAIGAERGLKVANDKSYGSALHEITPLVLGPGSKLRWRWRLEQPLLLTDLKRREGDDAPVKLCAMFDMGLEKVGMMDRAMLSMARGRTTDPVPAATLCYVWDHLLPAGARLANAFTNRLRFIVMDSGEKQLGQWIGHERDLAADFVQAFGHETDVMPPLIGIAVGADADNTQSTSLAYMGDITLTPMSAAASAAAAGTATAAAAAALPSAGNAPAAGKP